MKTNVVLRKLGWTLCLVCTLVFVSDLALAANKSAPPPSPGAASGRVTMSFGEGGFILSVSGGQGTLTYKGRRYPFKIGSIGFTGIGVSKVTAVGEVYKLTRVEDFPGTFVQARAGYAVGSGQGTQWLENTKGVVMKLRSTTKGVSLNIGADGLVVEMGPIRSR